MNSLSTTTSNTYTTNLGAVTGTTIGGFGSQPCNLHGWAPCNCNMYSIPTTVTKCGACGIFYTTNQLYFCTNYPTWTNTTTTSFPTWHLSPTLKEVKEITTDSELIYEWDGISSTGFHMKLPAKFSDCFLKVGYAWSPLYPLIFSAYENDSKEMSFYLVRDISDKIFEGNKVVLKSVTTTKIEDNLTLMQLTQRVRQYFEDK